MPIPTPLGFTNASALKRGVHAFEIRGVKGMGVSKTVLGNEFPSLAKEYAVEHKGRFFFLEPKTLYIAGLHLTVCMEWIFSHRPDITDRYSFLIRALSETCAEYLLVQGITPDEEGYEIWKRNKKREILEYNQNGDFIFKVSNMPINMFMDSHLQADTLDGKSHIVEKRINSNYEFLSEETVVSKSNLLPISHRFKGYMIENAQYIKDVRHLSSLVKQFASNVNCNNTEKLIVFITSVLSESSIGIKLNEFEIESIVEGSYVED
jgi:hypothetical protein